MNVGLLYICAFAGLVIVLGSLLLLWKGRILVDSSKGEISEVELPFGFKMKTQQPILVMFLFGAFLLATPIYVVKDQLSAIPKVVVSGQVQSASVDGLKAYAIIADSDVTNEVKFSLPLIENTFYRVKYYDRKNFVFDQVIDLSKVVDGTYQLPSFKLTNAAARTEVVAAAQSVSPSDIVKEEKSVVEDFKEELK
jgi:hypothetical protein